MKNPSLYGFNLQNEKLYPKIETKKIVVDSTINNLANFAIKQGVNYKTLKIFNPWLRDTKLENKTKKVYELELPVN